MWSKKLYTPKDHFWDSGYSWGTKELYSNNLQPICVTSNDARCITSEDDGANSDLAMYKPLKYIQPASPFLETIVRSVNTEDCPESLIYLLEGLRAPLSQDYRVPTNERPDWLDVDKFKAGQKFAMDHFIGVSYSQMLSLFMLFSVPGALEALVFTAKSSTPFTAYKRYLSTVSRVKSWFENDVWAEGNQGFENIKAVRAMHLNVSNKLNNSSRERIKDLALEGSTKHPNLMCPLSSKWEVYFAAIQERTSSKIRILHKEYSRNKNRSFFNQFEMGCTQFAFFGLMVMYPNRFGAGGATREDLENYVHCWRGIGYLLGVSDEFNFCKGSFDEVLQRCHDFVNEVVKLSFRNLSKDWEHMSRCVVTGISSYFPSPCFEAAFAYLCWTIGLDASLYYTSLTWAQYFQFNCLKFFFRFVLRIPGVLPILNSLTIRIIEQQRSLSLEELELLKQKKFS